MNTTFAVALACSYAFSWMGLYVLDSATRRDRTPLLGPGGVIAVMLIAPLAIVGFFVYVLAIRDDNRRTAQLRRDGIVH